MFVTVVGDRRYMKYEYYLKQPKSTLELKVNKIIEENPHQIKALARSNNHLLVRKHSNIFY